MVLLDGGKERGKERRDGPPATIAGFLCGSGLCLCVCGMVMGFVIGRDMHGVEAGRRESLISKTQKKKRDVATSSPFLPPLHTQCKHTKRINFSSQSFLQPGQMGSYKRGLVFSICLLACLPRAVRVRVRMPPDSAPPRGRAKKKTKANT